MSAPALYRRADRREPSLHPAASTVPSRAILLRTGRAGEREFQLAGWCAEDGPKRHKEVPILGPVEDGRGILAARIRSDGRYEEQLYAPGGGTKAGFTAETIARGDHFFKMKGNEVFKVAVRSMAEISRGVLCEAGLKTEDIDLFIPHQANQRITDAVSNALNVDESKVFSNIAQHGNTSSASIPIGLDECVESGRVKKDDVILMASFGGGFTWGAVAMRW